MSKLQRVRGTHDLMPNDKAKSRQIVETARNYAQRYGFSEIELPIFEAKAVFERPIGETTDVVAKELYVFQDRGGEDLALRPEGTAGMVRAYLENGLAQHGVNKLFYGGPMFRYERPQKGRQRQFTQFGCEMIGTGHYNADVDMVCLGYDIINALGIGADVTLEINTLGDIDSRNAYRTALVDYLTPYENELSADGQRRLHKNPLRILDSKDENDQKILWHAPKYDAYWNADSRAFFDGVQNGLTTNGITYTVNPTLVRGLDYYNHTVFEFITHTLGAQGTVLGGGRYDGLVQRMGGPPTPAVGFAGGVERLMLMIEQGVLTPHTVAVIPIGQEAEKQAWSVLKTLRSVGLCAEMAYTGNIKKRMKQADKIQATCVVIFGEDELANNTVTVRDLQTGKQYMLSIKDIEQFGDLLAKQNGVYSPCLLPIFERLK